MLMTIPYCSLWDSGLIMLRERGRNMNETGVIVRAQGEGEKRWHYGGGLHTWKATAEETNGAFLFFEDHMQQGKVTPTHIHPDADEIFYVLEGEIIVHLEGGTEHRLQAGGFFLALRGVPHAFMTTAETRLLCIHTPANAQAFYRNASKPSTDDSIDGPVDFAQIQAAANEYGGVKLVGPPPFAVAQT
jgi:quercetin dioxygenase-like cupin family protein